VSLVIAHLSDLHVSRFGEHVTSLRSRRMHGQAAKPTRNGPPWEPVATVDGWRIERRARELRLVDEAGTVHERRKIDGDDAQARRELEALVRERMRTEHARLASSPPSAHELEQWLAEDPGNTNLLWCRAAARLREDAPDWVLLTGDVTDDGVGYDLVLAALAPFVARRRVLAVPGNHDIYDSPPLVVPGHARKSRREKRALWATFAAALELPADDAWLRVLDEGALVCGFDSCQPARTPFSASGAVSMEALASISEALESTPPDACRLAMVHHHVVNLPFRAIGVAPWQLGMRLRNARAFYEFVQAHHFACVMNGHRHVGYRFHPNHAPLFVSAPSATLGCRSGAAPAPFYWRIEIKDREIVSVRERLL
jgi:3',5'-cyclic AMP phosphodiesterase CpdA